MKGYEINTRYQRYQTIHKLKVHQTIVLEGNGDILYAAISRLSKNYYEYIIGYSHSYVIGHRRSLKDTATVVKSYYIDSYLTGSKTQ